MRKLRDKFLMKLVCIFDPPNLFVFKSRIIKGGRREDGRGDGLGDGTLSGLSSIEEIIYLMVWAVV